MKIPKCEKTVTGRHKWQGGYTIPNTAQQGITGYFGQKYTLSWPEVYIDKECYYCGLIDDREENHEA